MQTHATTKKSLGSWCLFDWAGNSIPTLVITFIFSTYFTTQIAPNKIDGTAYWGWTISISAIIIAFIAPVLGSIVDQCSSQKRWLFALVLITAISSALLYFIVPSTHLVSIALLLVVITNIAYECSMALYNAMLPLLVPHHQLGRLSGWGWACGYAGGLISLALSLWIIKGAAHSVSFEPLRWSMVLAGCWFFVFSLPLFFFCKQTQRKTEGSPTYGAAWSALLGQLKVIAHQKRTLWFLISRLFYMDALNTIFAFGGIYAAGTFGFSFSDILLFGILLNITAGIGAALFAFLDDRWGALNVVRVSVLAVLSCVIVLLIIHSTLLFWIFAAILGVFVGPMQASSRTFMAQLVPLERSNTYFGLYAFSGKITAFVGPFLVGSLTVAFQSQRIGMTSTIVFFVIGLLILLCLPKANNPT